MDIEIKKGVSNNIQCSKDIINTIRTYLIQPSGSVTLSKTEFYDLIEGIVVKDITSHEQENLGITVLHAVISKDIEFDEHSHDNQSQVIFILKGSIIDLVTNDEYSVGESYYSVKKDLHAIKYLKDTEVLIFYMPKLEII